MRTNNVNVTPTLAETIQVMIDSNLIELHVCLPGKIVKYDASTQYADVLPSLKRGYEDGSVLPWPVIPNVPVAWPRASEGNAFLHMPLLPGDDVTLWISERSLDNWKQTGELSDPQDRRKFNITDAIAYPGCSGKPNAFELDNPQAVTLQNTDAILELEETGKYKIKGGNSDELITILSDFMNLVAGAFTTTSLGPEPLINASDPGFVNIQARINAFKG